MIGFDPILLQEIPVKKWLLLDPENIIFFLKSNKKFKNNILCLKKSYFKLPHPNDIYLECLYENGALMIDKTYNKSDIFRNIGFFFNSYTMIDYISLQKCISEKGQRFFSLNIDSTNKEFIGKEFLEMSEIGLQKFPKLLGYDTKKDKAIFDENLPWKQDVYFNDLISRSLKNYSGIWYRPINNYLLNGESYFNTNKKFIGTS